MIKVSNLFKTIGEKEILKDLSIHVETGSIYGLVGQNGSGKTTVIKHMAGVYKPDSGRILYDGSPVWENPSVKDRIGYIPDDLTSMNAYTMKEAAHYCASIYSEWDQERFDRMSGSLGLDMKIKLKDFSKGVRKQAAFALILSLRPKYVLLDEPVDGLDPVVRRVIWKALLKDVSENGTSILVSSHNLNEIENVCDTVGIIESGSIVLERKLADIKNDVHKLQLALPEKADPAQILRDAGLTVLGSENYGSVSRVIVKGSKNEIRSVIRDLDPVVFDILPMTLEEIFIVEQEAVHGVRNIFI
ncbi:MAG: ABC transporter ATP-binding protein [Anaerovoracaceae bacterium]|nr:ABC transporter ATP-binding protein [Bacillota bacterium]MDY2670873.1 ABC transporter ATP-binding protein [Anaerovoracaceae bacterium]